MARRAAGLDVFDKCFDVPIRERPAYFKDEMGLQRIEISSCQSRTGSEQRRTSGFRMMKSMSLQMRNPDLPKFISPINGGATNGKPSSTQDLSYGDTIRNWELSLRKQN